jgi:hypothetical protein
VGETPPPSASNPFGLEPGPNVASLAGNTSQPDLTPPPAYSRSGASGRSSRRSFPCTFPRA